jgi:hypothetical protein
MALKLKTFTLPLIKIKKNKKIFFQRVGGLHANRTEASFILFICKDKLSDFQCRSWW